MKYNAFSYLLKKLILTFFIGFYMLSVVLAQKTVKVAVRAHSGAEAAVLKWSATTTYLTNNVEGYTFQLVPLVTFEEMRAAVKNNEVDFVLTNPTAYIDLGIKYGITRISTLKNRRENGGYKEFGAVLFVKSDKTEINTLRDIVGKSIMGVSREAFGGWQMAYRELLEIDIDPFKDCSEVLFSSSGTQEKIVEEVLAGNVDIGTVRTGILENLEKKGSLDLKSIKIIEPIADNFPLIHTTRLYPEWPFAKLKNTDESLGKKVAVSLLQMPKNDTAALNGDYTEWVLPLNYNQVMNLLKTLELAPFEDYSKISLVDFFRLYWYWFLISGLILLLALLISVYISALNKKLSEANIRLEEKVESRRLELLKAEKNWENIFNSLGTPAQLLEKDYTILYVNDETLSAFGLARKDIIGKKCHTLFHQDDKPSPCCPLQESVVSGVSVPTEVVFEAKNKTYVVNCSPVFDYQGNMEYFVHVMTDVTDKKRITESLSESQKRFETLFNFGADAIFVYPYSESGFENFVELNRIACMMFGYSREEFLKLSPVDIASQPDIKRRGNEKERAKLEEVKNKVFEAKMIKKSGEVFPVEISSTVFDYQGQKSIMSVVRDITDRKRAEKELTIEKEFSEKIINTSNAIIIGLDKNHLIQIFNKGAETVTGYTEAEMIGKDWFKIFFPKELLEEMNKVWKDAWGIQSHSYENPILIKTGEERMVSWQSTGFYEGEDSTKHLLISIGEDITERKQTEEELKKYREHLEELVKERTRELEDKNRVLERTNKAFVGRELRMKELKKEIKKLKGNRKYGKYGSR